MKLKTKFQDEDFELGEVVDATINTASLADTHIKLKAKAKRGGEHMFYFSRISELFELFEDYEEPEEYWFIDYDGGIIPFSRMKETATDRMMKQIGNYFETEEEAEKAVEKLKTFKRLKDKGFRFTGYTHKDRGRLDELEIYCQLGECPENIEEMDDVHLLFGGEE